MYAVRRSSPPCPRPAPGAGHVRHIRACSWSEFPGSHIRVGSWSEFPDSHIRVCSAIICVYVVGQIPPLVIYVYVVPWPAHICVCSAMIGTYMWMQCNGWHLVQGTRVIYEHVLKWSDFPIAPLPGVWYGSHMRICIAMFGVPHRTLVPALPIGCGVQGSELKVWVFGIRDQGSRGHGSHALRA